MTARQDPPVNGAPVLTTRHPVPSLPLAQSADGAAAAPPRARAESPAAGRGAGPGEAEPRQGELTKAAKRVLVTAGGIIGPGGLALAVLGAIGSFATVRHRAHPYFGRLDWIVPITVDLGIVLLLAWDLVQEYLARKNIIDRGLPVQRWVAWLFVAGTVYLNVAAGNGDPTGIVMHAAPIGLFVVIVEGIRVTIRRWARLAKRLAKQRRKRERRQAGLKLLWLVLFPLRAFPLWRRAQELEMLETYSRGLDMERIRAEATTAGRTIRAHVATVLSGAAGQAQTQDVSDTGAGPAEGLASPPPTPAVADGKPAPQPPAAAASPHKEPPAARPGSQPGAKAGGGPSATAGIPAHSSLFASLTAAMRQGQAGPIHDQLTGQPDLTGFAQWLGSARPRGYKRLLALSGLAATGWQDSAAARRWITSQVPGPAGTVDKAEIRRMARLASDPASDDGLAADQAETEQAA